MNEKEQAIYLLGLLGYRFDDLENALKLLEENEFDSLVDFYYELENYNIENETASKISLAGSYPSLKIKDADWYEVEGLMRKCKVSI